MKYDVFVSYSRKDSDIAERICDIFDRQEPRIGYFLDRKGIGAGNDFPEVLAKAIEESAVVLFLASRNSYESDYTAKEVTYTISKKGSTALLPLIIDGSRLPPGLEFQLSNINWRVLGPGYTLEGNLIDDIVNRLKDPSAGETLEARKHRKDRKVLFGSIAAVCAILAATLLIFGRYSSAKARALSDSATVKGLVSRADSLILHAGKVADPFDSEGSLDEELRALDLAARSAIEADEVMLPYRDGEYMPYFSADPSRVLQTVAAKKDSMFVSWRERATDAYDYYRRTGSEVEKELAVRFAMDALKIHPDDEEMNTIKNIL